jgi:hypothetical protein
MSTIFHLFHYAREKKEVNCGFNLARAGAFASSYLGVAAADREEESDGCSRAAAEEEEAGVHTR